MNLENLVHDCRLKCVLGQNSATTLGTLLNFSIRWCAILCIVYSPCGSNQIMLVVSKVKREYQINELRQQRYSFFHRKH